MTNKPQTFGWIPPEDRTLEEERANVAAIAAMPKFAIKGRTNYAEGKVLLFKFWEHPDTVTALGFPFPGVKQITGSCVGAGGGNALATLAMCDAIMRKEPEQIVIPFWPLPYGRSRFYMGDRSLRLDEYLHAVIPETLAQHWVSAVDSQRAQSRVGVSNA